MSSSTKKYKYKRFLKVRVQGRTNLEIILYFAEPCFQGAINIVDHKGDDYPRYVTLYENGLMQFSTLETSHDDSASSSPPPSPTPPPPVQEEEQDTDTGGLLYFLQ